jgi:hypothetical protein
MKSFDTAIHLETMLTQMLLVQQSPEQTPCPSVHEHTFHLNRSASDAHSDPTTLAQLVEMAEPVEMVELVEMAEPVEMVEPVEMAEPVEMVEPVEMTEPVEMAVSVEPSGLAAPDSHQVAY